jgi:hypothetical protein
LKIKNMATLSHPNPTWFRPDNRWLLVGACLSLALLIGVPALWSVKHMVLACGAVLVVGSVLFSVERSLFLLLFLNIVLPIKILLVMRLPGGLRFQEGLLLAVIVFALIDLIYTKGLTLRLSRADIPLLTFLGATCLSLSIGLLRGNESWLAMRDVRYPFYYVAFFLVTNFFTERQVLNRLVPLLMVAALGVSIGYILEFIGAIDLSVGTSFVRVVRLHGLILPIALLFMINQLLHDPKRYPRPLLIALFLPIGIALVLTVGRSMWIALGVGLIVSVYLREFTLPRNQQRIGRSLFIILSMLVLMGLSVFFLQRITGASIGAQVAARSNVFLDIAQAPTFMARFFSYSAALEAISNHPLLGSGQGATITFPIYNFDHGYFETWTTWTLDSLYLTLLFKMGVVGLVAFIWLCLRLLGMAYHTFVQRPEPQVKAFAASAFAFLCGFGVLGLSDASMVNGRFALVYAVLFGMIAVLEGNKQSQPE